MRVWVVALASGCGSMAYYGQVGVDPTSTSSSSPDDPTVDTGTPPDDSTSSSTSSSTESTSSTDDPTSSSTSGTTPSTESCTYPSYGVTAGLAAGAMANPTWIGLSVYGIASGRALLDYDAAGSGYSAVADFSFYDANSNFLCDIAYDASGSVPTSGWTTDSGGALFESWDLVLANGQTCGTVNGQDLRAVVESYAWGVGLGELVGLESFLESAVTGSGQDWAVDWAPYTYGLYAEGGLFGAPGAAVEAGYAQNLDRDCSTVLTDAYGYGFLLPLPVAGPLDDYVTSQPLLITAFPTL